MIKIVLYVLSFATKKWLEWRKKCSYLFHMAGFSFRIILLDNLSYSVNLQPRADQGLSKSSPSFMLTLLHPAAIKQTGNWFTRTILDPSEIWTNSEIWKDFGAKENKQKRKDFLNNQLISFVIFNYQIKWFQTCGNVKNIYTNIHNKEENIIPVFMKPFLHQW